MKTGRPRTRPQQDVPTLIEMLHLRRRSKRISLEKLSATLRVSPYTIGRWERGEMTPSLVQATAWAEALGLRLRLVEQDFAH